MDTATKHKVEAVVIGASAGGVQALLTLLSALPASFRLPIITVLHLPANRDSQLAEVFQHRLALTVREAADKETIAPGTVYFAAPGYHLSVENDRTFSLSGEAPLQFCRPSIDVLMESAADAYGAALLAIVLTGANADGADGLARVKRLGGLTAVQDPAEAAAVTMPKAAIHRCRPDFILNLDGILELLLKIDT